MNSFDKAFQKGSTFLLVLGIAGTLFFSAYAVFEPDDRTFSLIFVILGLAGTWRQYLAWNEKRK